MNSKSFQVGFFAAIASVVATGQGLAMTADQLARRLAAGDPIRVVDVRPQQRFATGSIPGAMNIPASVILEKPLPALGHVVLFDDGLGTIDVAALVATLDRRAGWHVEALEGGLAAWQALKDAPVTGKAGLRDEVIQHITYDKLDQLQEPVVVVDLRSAAGKPARPSTRHGAGKPPADDQTASAAAGDDSVRQFCQRGGARRQYLGSATELRGRFEAVRRNHSQPLATGVTATPPLVVLVDRGDGDCRETARRLRSEGFTRIVILAGGDEAIRLQGRRGKGRVGGVVGEGSAATAPTQTPPSITP